ncbi:hypothetical protein [Mesorhizobium sp. M0208]|uniref:hypothetical protein n=1 Tax=unclassified Mesorhizobium TaxID=325217 RepID=UPI00333CEF7B
MAKSKIGREPTTPVPVPSNDLQDIITRTIWPVDQVIHRSHLNLYAGSQFNPGFKGNARFSPIKNANGASIPTLSVAQPFTVRRWNLSFMMCHSQQA